MDLIDGTGLWISGVAPPSASSSGSGTGGTWKPIWVPRRRAWWWIVLPWLWFSGG